MIHSFVGQAWAVSKEALKGSKKDIQELAESYKRTQVELAAGRIDRKLAEETLEATRRGENLTVFKKQNLHNLVSGFDGMSDSLYVFVVQKSRTLQPDLHQPKAH
jgi:hypothetical protein